MTERKLFTNVTVSDWQEAKRKLTNFGASWAFRGQRDAHWELISSLERNAVGLRPVDAERVYIRLFQRRAHHFLHRSLLPENFENLLEWLALMQHYGVPTRLQDWTKSPYVATFFALEKATNPSIPCAVWAVDLEWLKSQAVRQISKAGATPVSIQLSTVFREPTLFQEVFRSGSVKAVVPLSPSRFNDRLSVQQGLFLCPTSLEDSFMENFLQFNERELPRKLLKFTILSKVRLQALTELEQMNITRASLFPGIDGFAQSLITSLSVLSADKQIHDQIKRGLEEGFLYT